MGKRPYSYEFPPLALDDLRGILDYITIELSSPSAAEKLIDKMQVAVENLCEFPFSHPLISDAVLSNKGYRLLVVDNFHLFYVVCENKVIVRRVLYGRRKFEWLL